MSKVVTRASRAGPSTTTITDPASVRRQGVSTRAYQAYYPAPEYTVSTIERNGVRTEVLTIEDTPPPVAGPSGTRNGSSRNESSKKRKNEGGENGERASKRAYDEVEVKANGSKNKRKMESDDGRHGSGSSRSVSDCILFACYPLTRLSSPDVCLLIRFYVILVGATSSSEGQGCCSSRCCSTSTDS